MDKENKNQPESEDKGAIVSNEGAHYVSTDPLGPLAQPSPVIPIVEELPNEDEDEEKSESSD